MATIANYTCKGSIKLTLAGVLSGVSLGMKIHPPDPIIVII